MFADGALGMVTATPMTQDIHPETCALAPDMTILACNSGHNGYEDMLDEIREHAGL